MKRLGIILLLASLLAGCRPALASDFSTETHVDVTNFTISNFEYRLLRTDPERIYDEYEYKVDISNRSSELVMFSIFVKFYDAKGFEVDQRVDIQKVPSQTTVTVSHKALVHYPQAADVKDAKVEVQVGSN